MYILTNVGVKYMKCTEHNFFETSKESIESMYTIGNTVSIINTNGLSNPDLNTPNKLVFSPFGSLFYLAEFDENIFRVEE